MTTPVDQVSADLAIVGGGGSGLAAALEAAQRGLKVVVLEKTAKLGGTTASVPSWRLERPPRSASG